jgi:hypothetical protein
MPGEPHVAPDPRKLINYAKRVTTFGPENAVIMVTRFA